MKLFFSSLLCVMILSALCGYIALYTPKIPRSSNVTAYPEEFIRHFENIEARLKDKQANEVIQMCNETILTAVDKKIVAKAYFLRSKAHHQLGNLEDAKKDLLYAKEIDFNTFSTKAAYSFIKSLRELQLYESELFSGARTDIKKEMIYSVYYGVVLISIISLITLLRAVRTQKKGLSRAKIS